MNDYYKIFLDQLNLISQVNRKKAANIFNVRKSYRTAQNTKDPVHPAFPQAISIEPTTACNLRCPECVSGLRAFTRPTGHIKEEVFRRIIDQLSDHLIYLTFYFQGEPYLVPHFHEMVAYAKSKGIYVATSTNAHFIDPEAILASGIDKIIISVDGANQESYQKYRIGGDLTKVLDNTKKLIKARGRKAKPFVDFQFVVFRHNEHEMKEAKSIARELGVDRVTFKSAQIYGSDDPNNLLPASAKSRYEKDNEGNLHIKSAWSDKCWRMWSSCVFTWDGDIVPCCFDKDAKHKMGNIMDQDFSEIWNGPAYLNFRQQLLKSRSEIDICKNCTEGLK